MTVWGFGIVQAQELEGDGRDAFAELTELVSDAIGVTFEPTVAGSHKALARALEQKTVGLAWVPPIPTLTLEERGVATVLGIPTRHGRATYHAALIVRRGGPRSLADLRSRRVAWVNKESAAGYLVPRMHLSAQGIDVTNYFSREVFVHSHPAVIDAVVNGDADVGATYCHVEARRDGRPSDPPPRELDPTMSPMGGAHVLPKVVRGGWMDDASRSVRPIDVLTTFGPIPNDALVASNDLPASARGALVRWLLDPSPRARELLQRLLGSSDFRMPSPAHYDPLRHMLRTAKARGLVSWVAPDSTRTQG